MLGEVSFERVCEILREAGGYADSMLMRSRSKATPTTWSPSPISRIEAFLTRYLTEELPGSLFLLFRLLNRGITLPEC